ncbi:DUF3617 domain-containing protein [Novosphingobium sp. KCTC 2891]|uniref:DUF3617 domain-containing protein n=1 Tax=Novosphingobium sp. KCTC 2891 TaxID=2989730 RepID=UPI002223B8E0|nr:hypothetical protein [Novosphingobium sp. KCTC 2891]
MRKPQRLWRILPRVLTPVLAGGLAAHGAVLLAERPPLAMLDRFESGEWEVRERGERPAAQRRCIGTGRQLIQIRHAQQMCRSYVVEDGVAAVTVHYSCQGNGFGRTRIRFENPRLAQIETQGVASGLPFDFAAEARRVGACRR